MTTYEEIYDFFLSKIEDYQIKEQLETKTDIALDFLFTLLRSSIPKFTYSVVDLSDRSDDGKYFNIQLDHMEKEILGTLMVIEYLSPKILRDELLEEKLGSKDFRLFSPANQLKELRALRDSYKTEANSLMSEYYYRRGI
ncbi:hypothetical protein [Bacillus infantis]|uniref:hypothetical protein n=1 Tax=Bacillus infantis TaxID=324767 RepID=UPI003CEAFBD0